jgi:hypothetical protein
MRLTEMDREAIQSLHRRSPYQIINVSNSQLAIARHYGGITFQGCAYTYDPTDATLMRDDVLKFLRGKAKKAGR